MGKAMSDEERALRQCWGTPWDLYEFLNDRYRFQLDAAAVIDNAKCALYITPKQDALSEGTPWVGLHGGLWVDRVFVNPGFSNMGPWVRRAKREADKSWSAAVVAIGPLSAAAWMGFCLEHAQNIYLLTPRPDFIAPPGVEASKNTKDVVAIEFCKKVVAGPARVSMLDWRSGSSVPIRYAAASTEEER